MAIFVKYCTAQYERQRLIEDLKIIRDKGYQGVFFSLAKSYVSDDQKMKYFPVARMIELAGQTGLKVGVIIDCFQNPFLWHKETFTAPVNYAGATYNPRKQYLPICPNNPIGLDFYHSLLAKVYRLGSVDYCLLENLRFPFFWQEEDLDVQHRVPPFCYCPFCVTEFSSMIGEVVSFTSQIVEMLPDWLEWRSEIIMNLVHDARDVLMKRTQLIVTTPPLALIDLPFATGQLPLAYVNNGCLIAPALYHRTKTGNLLWIEDMIDQYRLEFKMNKLFPIFKVSNEEELKQYLAVSSMDPFAGVLVDRWQSLNASS
ncbi:MAG: hypothetical protein WCY30_06455 [Candidatus Neomarinimicrobiota bacterium]